MNNYNLSGQYGIGYTSNTNQAFYFDLEDYDKIKDYTWREDKDGYIVTNNKNGCTRRLHRIITNCPPHLQVDHIYHNTYDNRKEKLRICTNQQNNMNKDKPLNNTSGYKGVSWSKSKKKWHSYIRINKRRIHLGYFDDIADAINARQKAEQKFFGEFRYNVTNKQNNIKEEEK